VVGDWRRMVKLGGVVHAVSAFLGRGDRSDGPCMSLEPRSCNAGVKLEDGTAVASVLRIDLATVR